MDDIRRPRSRVGDKQRAAMRRMQDFRPVTPRSIRPVERAGTVSAEVPQVRQQAIVDQRLPASRSRKPIIIAALVVALAVIGLSASWWFGFRAKPVGQSAVQKQTESQAASAQVSTVPTTIRLIASGDQLPHLALTQSAKTASSYNYTPFFERLTPHFNRAAVRFCNQETVSAGEQYGITGYPSFNVSTQFARDLNQVGCNVINLANNHMHDKGQAGINETLKVWEELKPLAIAGANRDAESQSKVSYFTQNGIKFAFVSYTEVSNTSPSASFSLNMLRDELVSRQMTEARAQADIVLVGVHWGTEYSDGINSVQDSWGSKFAALGADVVIGTGPHVLEPVKRLPKAGGGETIVWYSLGNLLSAQLDVPSLIGGLAVMDINVASKKIDTIGFMPTYMHYEWTAAEKAREDLLKRKNFKLMPLDQAAESLKLSQNNTTVEAQTERVRTLLNKYTIVPILTSEQYLKQ